MIIMKDNIEHLLNAANVRYEFIPLPEDLPVDVASHMNFYKDSLDHAYATMIYKTEKGFIAVSRRGDTRVNSKKLREALGIKRLSLATEEDMSQLGLTPGLVPPLGYDLPIYMDKKLLDVDYFYDGTGHKLFGLKMNARDLLKVNNATVGDYTVFEDAYAKKRVLAGMRASGRLHLGNYLGGAKGMLALQNDPNYETFYMVADLHAITTPYDKNDLKVATRNVIMDYLAAGLDPEKSTLFVQSQIPEHTELAYLVSTVETVARMQHLPTYKDKIKQFPEHSTMALLNYPILMAADILLYKANLVPVGIDQEPHLEVAREIARKMNSEYGTDFPEPQRFTVEGGEYIPSLTGEGKMSKSVEGSYILLTDDLNTIKERLAKVPTDSGKGDTLPISGGVASLLKFVELFEGFEKRRLYEQSYQGEGLRYKDLKEELAEVIFKELEPVQKRREHYINDPSLVDRILEQGAEKARKVTKETIKEVKDKMGFLK
jgi:tryptophanyl-tRNA synthetase